MWIEIQYLFKLKVKYFYQFWSLIEVGIIVCSWSSVGMYIWRYVEFKRISSLFSETNGYVYINLELAAYINDLLRFFYSFSCFLGTVKFLHLCRFNQRLTLFSLTLQYAAKGILAFGMMFSLVYMSFLCLFYLLFNAKLLSCSSLLQTTEMLFEMALLRYSPGQLTEAAAFLGPFCFSIFIFLVVFICLSMFLSIIIDSFRRAREHLKNNTEEELFSFMLNRFLRWTGLRISYH
jgi:hypothetical protein